MSIQEKNDEINWQVQIKIKVGIKAAVCKCSFFKRDIPKNFESRNTTLLQLVSLHLLTSLEKRPQLRILLWIFKNLLLLEIDYFYRENCMLDVNWT